MIGAERARRYRERKRRASLVKGKREMEPKPKLCASCGVIERGAGLNEVLRKYRDKNICSWCIAQWQKKEKEKGREFSFLEFRWWGEKPPMRKEKIPEFGGGKIH